MKKMFIIILLSICIGYVHAQLPDKNTLLIARLNAHPGYAGLWGYVTTGGVEYALLGCFEGTAFVNISDSSNVYEADFVPGIPNQWREVRTYSHYAYVISEGTNSKLQIIDLQYLPDSVSLVNTFAYPGFTRAHNFTQSGSFLFLFGGNVCPAGGAQILELTNPVLPIVRGFDATRYVHDGRILSDTIWAANILNQRVSIINASDKDNLQEVRSYNSLEPMPHNIAISADRKILYLTHENETPPGRLEIWNIEDLEDITYIGVWQPAGITTSITHNIEIFDDYAYIAHYTAGLRILDISNPATPVEVAWYDTRPQDNGNSFQGCWGVYKFPSGKIIASDISNGLFVVRADIPTEINNNMSQPGKFILYQNHPNPFNPATVIRYSLNENSFVQLKIYDVLGNEVATLVEEKQIEGVYNYTFSTANSQLPSGVYYYRLESGAISETKKMLLLK